MLTPEPAKPKSSDPFWRHALGIALTVVLGTLFAIVEIGQAASSNVHTGFGQAGLPFYLASVFAPGLLLRYWEPAEPGVFSKRRILLLLALGSGAFGWVGNLFIAF